MGKQRKNRKKTSRKTNLAAGAFAFVTAATMIISPVSASAASLFPIKQTSPSSTVLTNTLNGLEDAVGSTVNNVVDVTTGIANDATDILTGATSGGSTDTSEGSSSNSEGTTNTSGGSGATTGETSGGGETSPASAATDLLKQATETVGSAAGKIIGGLTAGGASGSGGSPGSGSTTGSEGSTTTTSGKANTTNGGTSHTTTNQTNPAKTATDLIKNTVDTVGSTVGQVVNTGTTVLTGSNSGNGGLAHMNLLSNETLSARLDDNNGKYKLSLDLAGNRTVTVKALGKTYIYFTMPDEFKSLLADSRFKKSVKASYSVPFVSLLGVNAFDSGTFSSEAIHVDKASNSIVLTYSPKLSVNIVGTERYSLQIDLSMLPPSKDKLYSFYAAAADADTIPLDLLVTHGAKADIPLKSDGTPGGDNSGGTNPGGGGNSPGSGNGDTSSNGGDNGSGNGDNGNGSGSGGNNGSSGGNGSGSSTGGGKGTTADSGGIGSVVDWIGNHLPKTASTMWNIGAVGLGIVLLGLAIKYFKFRKLT